MNWYEAKQEEKRQRLQEAAAKRRRESDARYQAGRQIMEMIPPGQPILIGHHSEKGHRAALRRIDNHFKKSLELHHEAKELEHRAAAVGTGGISSDDPDAPEKLTAKLKAKKALRERMKRVNALWRKRDAEGLKAEGLELEALDREIAGRYSWEKQPFPKWQIQNLGAEIRRLEQRIEMIGATRATPGTATTLGAVTVIDDPDENRVAIEFPKADEALRAVVKSNGWRWSPTRRAWVRKRGLGVYELALRLVQQVHPTTEG